MTRARIALGQRGEELAVRELDRLGYRIVQRNIRTRAGEIDILAERDGVLAFVEVRTRRGVGYGTPEESVNRRKLEKMEQSALEYLADHALDDAHWSLDLVAVQLSPDGRLVRLEHSRGLVAGD